ncbi:hypothetical protein [Chloroflexus sp.]|uniref:hypothetical protein n=1 Tax=Chloroflexus sp. TaxID=1904827 RepID=UPI002609D970|nr:hypothetical protein [uncultured Chloroflexus sp.]
MSAGFTLIEPLPMAVAPPGPWQPLATGGAFASGDQMDVIWQAHLPSDLATAQMALRAAQAQLGAHEIALATVEQRLQRLVSGTVSFSVSTPPAEQNLLNVLSATPASASFGLRDEIQERWQAAQEQVIALSAQVWEALTTYATVETVQGGQLIGRTRINWHGDARSLLLAGIDLAQARMHQQTLALALRSRAGLLRLIGLVGRGAAIVASMVASPAGPVLALPAVWQFVQDVLAEVRQPVV